MIRVYIPRYKLKESEGGRNYYAYVLEVCYAGKSHKIEKRYSAFHHLYKELQKTYITGEFPPKRLRNTSSKVLELRRAGLEAWLQSILRIRPLPQSVINFIHLSNYKDSILETADQNSNEIINHRPILTYTKDPFLFAQDRRFCVSLQHFCSPPLNNIVTKGVLTALYDSSFNLNQL